MMVPDIWSLIPEPVTAPDMDKGLYRGKIWGFGMGLSSACP